MVESTPSHAKKRKKVYTFLYQGVDFTKETKPILAENAEAQQEPVSERAATAALQNFFLESVLEAQSQDEGSQ